MSAELADFTEDYVSEHAGLWRTVLHDLIGQPVHMLEIGSFEGRSAVWFLREILIHPESTLTCVDDFPVPARESRFDKHVGLRARKIKAKSFEALLGLRREGQLFDAIYVDGSHRAADVVADGLASWFLLRDGGVLIFDDYLWEHPDLSERPEYAVDLVVEVLGVRAQLLHKDYQVVLKKR